MSRTSSPNLERVWGLLPACLGLLAIAGCSDQPAPPPRFQLNPQQAAHEAMKLYDTNGDGVLDVKELQASPPLMDLLQNLKAQPSGHPDTLTEADIAGRLEEWVKSSTTLLPAIPTVWLDGRPLAGATVTFEPEPFLGPSYRSHKGETNGAGIARLDPDLQDFPGVYVGLYRIRISKTADGKEIVPARFNTKTELGLELSLGARDGTGNTTFRLKSK